MSTERGHVRRLIEEPEPLPVVASLPKVFRVDKQFLDSPGLPGRIVRQRDGRTTLEQCEGRDHDCQGRQKFPHFGILPPSISLGSVCPHNPCAGPIRGTRCRGLHPRLELMLLGQHDARARLTPPRTLVRCVAARIEPPFRFSVESRPRNRRRVSCRGGSGVNRRTSGLEARRQARRVRCFLHRHPSPLPIVEDFPDSSFEPVLPSPCPV